MTNASSASATVMKNSGVGLQIKDPASLMEKRSGGAGLTGLGSVHDDGGGSMLSNSLHYLQSQLGLSPHQLQSLMQQQQQAMAVHHVSFEKI